MNKINCGDCDGYFPENRIVQGNKRPLKFGWCSKKSTFPANMQGVPAGATVVAEGEQHTPVMVDETSCIQHCLVALRKSK